MLVDGNNLLMRCIKAMEYSGLRSEEDWQTGPLTAFVAALGRFTREHRPDSLVICWDHGPSERRVQMYPEYKAARGVRDPEAEERKETAFGMTKEFLRLTRIQQVSVKGFEADDVVAAYWANAYNDTQWDWTEEDLPWHVLIVSGDKDFFQLLDRGTKQLRPDGTGGYQLWDAKAVEAKYGCKPDQLPDYMALVGDPVDGVPGVRGIGPKKALKALQAADWDLAEVQVLKEANNFSMAILSLVLVNLRMSNWHPQVPDVRPFNPIDPSERGECLELVTFLRALGMETILSRFYTGTLWK
jgi:DNA polymerase I